MKLRTISRYLLAFFFISAGINHFISPEIYLAMMPPWLPAHGTMNALSGVAEITGGFGLLIPKTRRAAGLCLIMLLTVIFPANIHVALNGWPGVDLPRWALFARLPFQIILITWVVYSSEIFRKNLNPSSKN